MKKPLIFLLLVPALVHAAVPTEVTAQTSSLAIDALFVGGGFLAAIAGIKALNLIRGTVEPYADIYTQVSGIIEEETSLADEARENWHDALDAADYWDGQLEIHEQRISAAKSFLSTS